MRVAFGNLRLMFQTEHEEDPQMFHSNWAKRERQRALDHFSCWKVDLKSFILLCCTGAEAERDLKPRSETRDISAVRDDGTEAPTLEVGMLGRHYPE